MKLPENPRARFQWRLILDYLKYLNESNRAKSKRRTIYRVK